MARHDNGSWVTPALIAGLLACSNASLYASLAALLAGLLLAVATRALPPAIAAAPLRSAGVCGLGMLLALACRLLPADTQAAYAHLIIFAVLATSLALAMPPDAPRLGPGARLAVLLLVTATLIEVCAWGTAPLDRELAFAGALHGLQVRIFERGPLPWLGQPAGTLLLLGLLLAQSRMAATPATPTPTIDSPRAGRRVRVTGNIR